ncbi:hypothetical protein HDU82_006622, partial [Entophlyctis luteolus]
MQTFPLGRMQYTGQLSLNSPCRKNLQRFSYLWVLAEALKLLSPIGATGVLSQAVRTHADTVGCIQFQADLDLMRDRLYPTLTSSAGVAEYLFGNALGCMRSEHSDCPANGSLFAFGPQLDGVVGQGDTILGNGFTSVIATTCECTDVSSQNAVENGILTLQDQKTMAAALQNLSVPFLMMFDTVKASQTQLTSYSVLGHMQVCGGFNPSIAPVCFTTINGLSDAAIAATFITDGTTASISLSNSVPEQYFSVTTISVPAVQFALEKIWPPGEVYPLVSNVAGMLNALIYWCSSDLVAVDPTLIEPGMETLYSILLRAGIQRTWDSKGANCVREISRNDQTIASLTAWGSISIYIAASIQIILSTIALVACAVWYFSATPLGPAVRVIKQPTYFMSVLCESPFAINLNGTGNAQAHVIWQAIDVVVRIGESLETIEEPDEDVSSPCQLKKEAKFCEIVEVEAIQEETMSSTNQEMGTESVVPLQKPSVHQNLIDTTAADEGRDKDEKDKAIEIERKTSQRRFNIWERGDFLKPENAIMKKSGESLFGEFGELKCVKETAVIKLFDVEESVQRKASFRGAAEADSSGNGSGNSKSTISIGLS